MILAGAAAGIVFGALVAALKYFLLWKSYAAGSGQSDVTAITGRMLASNGINVAALVVVFLTRNLFPFPFYASIIATAVALTVAGRLSVMRLTKNGEQGAGSNTEDTERK